MDANNKVQLIQRGSFLQIPRKSLRVGMSVALLGVMLGGCSSVPDVVNPAKWYEKTTDFFAGDNQAAGTADNQGLAADPQAPAPAPAQSPSTSDAIRLVENGAGGLSADAPSANYATPPIERQSAPSDVLRPQTEIADAPPPPLAQPTVPVMAAPVAAPVAPPAPMAPMAPPAPMAMAEAPSAAPEAPTLMPAAPQRPAVMSMEGAPPPPVFNAPANAMEPMGGDAFETVVISSSGMDMTPAPRRQVQAAAQPQQTAGGSALFPEPGTTTSGQVGGAAPAGMTRAATIHFANNSSLLDARDQSILGAVVQLQRERGGRVVVVGHASSRTRDMDYITHQMVNFQISMERAASIGNALKNLGLAGEALEIQAVSDTTPLYMEVMPSGEAGNRRVEIYLAH